MDSGRHDRDSDLGDDSPMSHTDEQSDREEEIRDCDSSDEGVNVNPNTTLTTGMDFGRSPEHISDMSHPSPFAQNHPLNLLNNLTALGMSAQHLQNLPHNDVLEKLKMQVRDMKVNLMDPDFSSLHAAAANYGVSMQNAANFAQSMTHNNPNGFSFQSPNSGNKDGNPASNSSASSEGSNSSQQNNGWSFEEQFKQVRQLYEINDDPKRKEFLDDLFQFMQKRGSPINRLPIMAKSVLDLYELYNLVIARGGLVDVINKKLWQEIIKGLHLPSSITSAAFTLRTQYMKYLYPYECEKKNLSTPSELQAAIDGNRREGRRSSYGAFGDGSMPTQLQMQSQMQRSPIPNLSQMSPLSLVTHNQHPAVTAANLMGAPHVPQDFEKRMIDYIKLFQTPKDPKRSQSPDPRSEAISALEMSRLALWNMYNNNLHPSPPNSQNSSPLEHQKRSLYNRDHLSDSPPPSHHHPAIKRERDSFTDFSVDRDRDFSYPPEKKRPPSTPTRTQTSQHHLDTSTEERPETPIHENGTDLSKGMLGSKLGSNKNGFGSDQGSPTSPALLNGMQFKIISRGNAAPGEQQLVVTMEVNGVQYEGVLFANQQTSAGNDHPPSTNKINTTLNTTVNSTTSSIDERASAVARPLVSS